MWKVSLEPRQEGWNPPKNPQSGSPELVHPVGRQPLWAWEQSDVLREREVGGGKRERGEEGGWRRRREGRRKVGGCVKIKKK